MDLSKHLDKAADAVKRRNYKLAASICNQLLAIQPDHGEARAMLRTALFKKAEAKPPSRIFALLAGGPSLAWATVARTIRRWNAAANACESYLALDPLNESVNLKLADALERGGHKRSALAVYRAFAEAQPRCLPACRRAGALLYEAGEFAPALAMFEAALRIDPRDQDSLKARKNLAAEGALRSSGIETAQSSRELIKDKDAQRRIEKSSRLQLDADEVKAELDELETKLAEQPDAIDVLVRVGDLRGMQNDLDGALDCFERAVSLAPGRADLADRAGELRLRQQEKRVADAKARGDAHATEQATRVWREMRVVECKRRAAHHPTDLGLRYDLGNALLDTDQVDAAIVELQQAIKDPKRKAQAYLQLGRAFWRKQLNDLALGQMQKALDAAGTGPLVKEICYDMGCVAEQAGRAKDALGWFTRILEQDIAYRDVTRKVEQLKSLSQS